MVGFGNNDDIVSRRGARALQGRGKPIHRGVQGLVRQDVVAVDKRRLLAPLPGMAIDQLGKEAEIAVEKRRCGFCRHLIAHNVPARGRDAAIANGIPQVYRPSDSDI